jgi:hypothetical protein
MEKAEKVILKIYQDLYEASTPSADFNSLLVNAEYNELGQKVIDFNSYEISELGFERIVKEDLKTVKLPEWVKQQIRNSVLLGASPRFKRESL